ncbi:MAG: hypothetical protein ACR2J7_04205 [Luteimonas sp.]
MSPRLPLLALLALALSACTGDRGSGAGNPAAPALDQPAADVPPATADDIADDPTRPVLAAGGGTGMPGPGTIRFDGFGPAAFGASAESVRMAWGRDLGSAGADSPDACYHLSPQPQPEGPSRIAFMIEGGQFVRVDVHAADITAPGGGKVGMSAEEIGQLYPGRVVVQPHKYLYDEGGKYLRIDSDEGGNGVLLFETDGNAVTSWRVGVPPQVDYVEGCS